MDRQVFLTSVILVALGGMGGAVAALAHMPMPWMTGALLTAALVARLAPQYLPRDYRFPQGIRLAFIAIIGLTIGLQINAELLGLIPSMLWSLGALALFVPLAQFGNYWIFRRFGGFDRPTAFFAGSPGGLMEALLMGEENGADVARLTLQQFLRIIVVITLVPAAMSIWVGQPVGSAAGLSGQMPTTDLPVGINLGVLVMAGALGLGLGRGARIPAGQLTGPLIAAGLLSLLPGPAPAMPPAALIVAQVVIGVSLGVRFLGLSRAMVSRGLMLAAGSVGFMLALAGVLIAAISPLSDLATDVLLISFAPGGVTEMGLIAITLAASPAVVAFHHIYRIVLTVLLMAGMARWMGVIPVPPSRRG